jgi:predicted metal-dependent peptidase
MLGLGRFHPWRKDYDEALARGITRTVEDAVAKTAEELTHEAHSALWGPVGRARRWVMNELPLFGALAAHIQIIADPRLCGRMDIGVAAINGWLGEMYFNPDRGLSDDEVLFIYVHELLHVALLHHTRVQGRDPLIWNYAADFVINGWLVEMGVGRVPSIGMLFDPRLKGMSAEEVYDLLIQDQRRCKGLRGFRGKLGDILHEGPNRRVFRGDVTTLDDMYRRCVAAGMACPARGLLPAGLLEEIKSLFTPPVPWDVELARWMEAHVPVIRDPLRTYARASRRQSSTPDIPRPAHYVPQEWKDACTFGVILDTSGSMDREMLGRALGAIASYAEARDVPGVRLILCDAAPYDRGIVEPQGLRGQYAIQGRGGTVLQPAINHLISRPDFPPSAPVMIITDGYCEEELTVPREHCFVLPRKELKQGAIPLRSSAPMFRVLKEQRYED